MASIYSYDQDEVWKAAAGAARRGGGRRTDANRRTLRRLGIPAHYAPAISCSWHGRGENAIKERRTELRAATKTRIAAIEKAAHRKIEMLCLDAQTQILAHRLTSAAAVEFFDALPKVEVLMPVLEMGSIEQMLEAQNRLSVLRRS